MAEIADSGGGGGGGKKRAKKSSTRVDMTPMVDLAFLLLTFFVLTSTFAEPKIMSLVYPAKEDKNEPIKDQPELSNGITFVLTENQVFYYKGAFKKTATADGPATELIETDFGPKGVRKLLADNNQIVIRRRQELELQRQKGMIADTTLQKELQLVQKKPKALKVMIKTDVKATCKNFIDLVDELKIADVGMIAPTDMTIDEEALLKQKIK